MMIYRESIYIEKINFSTVKGLLWHTSDTQVCGISLSDVLARSSARSILSRLQYSGSNESYATPSLDPVFLIF